MVRLELHILRKISEVKCHCQCITWREHAITITYHNEVNLNHLAKVLFARFLLWSATLSPPFRPALCKRGSLCRSHTEEVENNSPPPSTSLWEEGGGTSNIRYLEFFWFLFILSFIISMCTHGYLFYILHHLHTLLFLLLPKLFPFWRSGQMLAPVSLRHTPITSLLSDTYKDVITESASDGCFFSWAHIGSMPFGMCGRLDHGSRGGRLSWIIQLDYKRSNHLCLYKRRQREMWHAEEKVTWPWRKWLEEYNQKPRNAGRCRKRPGWDSSPEACSPADTVGLA